MKFTGKGDLTIFVRISGKEIPYKMTKTFRAKGRYLKDGENIYANENYWSKNLIFEIENEVRKRYRDVSAEEIEFERDATKTE